LNSALDGQVVRLPGYLLPLEFFARQVTEFLLVPKVGACVHTPPPNQILYVKADKPFDFFALFTSVQVTGEMARSTGLRNRPASQEADRRSADFERHGWQPTAPLRVIPVSAWKNVPDAMIAVIAATSMSAVNRCGKARRWRDRTTGNRLAPELAREAHGAVPVVPRARRP
jgi:hypothetical protein